MDRYVERHIAQRQLLKHLIAHRVKNGMSQKDVADRCDCTQSWISKLESSNDADVRLGDLSKYAKAIGLQMRTVFAAGNHTVVDEVKYHAFAIKRLMEQLTDLIGGDEKIDEGISNFICIEVPHNLLKMVVDVVKLIPHQLLMRLPDWVIDDKSVTSEQEDVPEPQRL